MPMPKPMHQPIGASQAELIELADSPTGTTSSEASAALGAPINHVSAAFSRMIKRGHVVRAHVTGHPIRWFTTQDAADSWKRATPSRVALDSRKQPKPVIDVKPLSTVTKIVRGVKVTKQSAPAYDHRFHVDPKAKIYGAGFSAAGIGVDVQTGQAWEA
jgi:hypothetical protein